MKKLLKRAVDSTVVRMGRYVAAQMPQKSPLFSELERRAFAESADYVHARMPRAVSLSTKQEVWDHALSHVTLDGLFVEFGVYDGTSINHIADRRRHDTIYGFDSFEGLKEDWAGHDCVKGAFDRGGTLPRVAANVRLVKGWFDQTLPQFLASHSEPFAFIHCDSDTYEAAKTTFDLIGGRIRTGTIIVFDEYFGYRGWKTGEFKAWQELVSRSQIEYEYLAFSTQEVSVRVTRT